ncbi:MAG: hypothetical protein JNL72_08080 [Flavipsychrobacter sp.]|nr:hypothetical protein [Flavipsychrobacter sp.]
MMKNFCLFLLATIALPALAAAQSVDSVAAAPKKEIQVTQKTVTAEDVIKKYIAAIGGEEVIKKISDLKIERSAIVQQVPIVITETRKTPDKLKITIEGMGMVFQKVVVNKDKGYQEYQGMKKDLSPQELTGTLGEADLLAKLHPEKYGITRELKGTEIVDSALTYVIEEKDATGKVTHQYYNAANGFLVRKSGNENTPQGALPTTTSYRGYREVEGSGGYKIPGIVRQVVGTQEVVSTLKVAEVNKSIPDKEFE